MTVPISPGNHPAPPRWGAGGFCRCVFSERGRVGVRATGLTGESIGTHIGHGYEFSVDNRLLRLIFSVDCRVRVATSACRSLRSQRAVFARNAFRDSNSAWKTPSGCGQAGFGRPAWGRALGTNADFETVLRPGLPGPRSLAWLPWAWSGAYPAGLGRVAEVESESARSVATSAIRGMVGLHKPPHFVFSGATGT